MTTFNRRTSAASRAFLVGLLMLTASLFSFDAAAALGSRTPWIYGTPVKTVKQGNGLWIPIAFQWEPGYNNVVSVTVNGKRHGTLTMGPASSSVLWWNYVYTDFAKIYAPGDYTVQVSICYVDPAPGPKFPPCFTGESRVFTIERNFNNEIVPGEWEQRAASGPRDKNLRYSNTSGKAVGAYYTNWSPYVARQFNPKDIPAENLTHLYHAFLGICSLNYNETARKAELANKESLQQGAPYTALKNACTNKKEFEVVSSDSWADIQKGGFDSSESTSSLKGIFAEYYRMKKKFPQVKVLASIGGFTMSDPFFQLAKAPAGRATFAQSVAHFLQQYDVFDGVDIDWEFPGDASNPAASVADKENFRLLLADLRTQLYFLGILNNRSYELHIAVGPSNENHLSKIDFAGIKDYVDRVNVMTYDYYGTWNTTLGHHTALGSCSGSALQPHGSANAVSQLDYIAARGFPRSKLNLGVASYGYAWNGAARDTTTGYPIGTSFTKKVMAPKTLNANGTPAPDSAYPPVTDLAHWVWGDGVIAFKGLERFFVPGGPGVNEWSFLRDWSDKTLSAHTLQRREDPRCPTTDYWWGGQGTMHAIYGDLGTPFITFDTAGSVFDKGNYVRTNDVGGLFMWELAGDSGTLMNAIQNGLRHLRR
jgi:chitinase